MTQLIALVSRAFGEQDILNKRLTEDWAKAGWPYYRAVWTECGEAIMNLNWLWWKQGQFGKPMTTGQRQQLQMELVDIWHFGLSMQIISMLVETDNTGSSVSNRLETEAKQYVRCFAEAAIDHEDYIGMHLENVVVNAIKNSKFDIRSFARACVSLGLTLEKLLALYAAKQTLNRFRWDHGYNLPKTDPGAYVKNWLLSTIDGNVTSTKYVEDNDHLTIIAGKLLGGYDNLADALDRGDFEIEIYKELEMRYPGPKRLTPVRTGLEGIADAMRVGKVPTVHA